MKRTIAMLLVLVMALATLASCGGGGGGLPEGMSTKDAARILLANERLDSSLLKESDGIFVSGAAAFQNLYAVAEANMVKYEGETETSVNKYYASGSGSGAPFAADESHTVSGGGRFERDGNVYRWSQFGEYSNSYDYFLNLTYNVQSSAMVGANLIDETKRNVRIVDKWVKIDRQTELLLHVEEGSETIYRRDREGYLELCRRYKRADGQNVYETFRANPEGGRMRMVYIPGEKFEYSYIFDDFNHNFLAENTKGFWEVVDVGHFETHYNVSCMVFKDDICYSAFYDPASREIVQVSVISPDKKTDILSIDGYGEDVGIDLQLQAFRGVDYVQQVSDRVYLLEEYPLIGGDYVLRYDTPDTPEDKGHTVYFSGSLACTVVTESGYVLNVGDTFLDGKVEIFKAGVTHQHTEAQQEVYIADLGLRIRGATYSEQMAALEQFLSTVGLECTRDFAGVRSGILQAYAELEQMAKYHHWNESPIATPESLAVGVQNNLKKHSDFAAAFEALKNVEVINYSNKRVVALNIHFAPIASQWVLTASSAELTASIRDLALTIEDTTIFVVGESYRVSFALAGSGGLVPLEDNGTLSAVYNGEESFTVRQSADVTLTIPGEGSYTLVAYIATAEDNIRSSGYQAVRMGSVAAHTVESGATTASVAGDASGALVLTVGARSEIEVSVEPSVATAEAMYEALAAAVYTYGFVDEGAALEMKSGDTWVTVAAGDSALADGVYRLAYSIRNGDSIKSGYVYTSYTAK